MAQRFSAREDPAEQHDYDLRYLVFGIGSTGNTEVSPQKFGPFQFLNEFADLNETGVAG
jgi:hypothetical protein